MEQKEYIIGVLASDRSRERKAELIESAHGVRNNWKKELVKALKKVKFKS
jgi:hypothetical protein